MGQIDKAVDIGDLGQRNLWIIYGKSGSGKTEVLSTFPKPLLYLQIGDDGSNTIKGKEGIKAIKVKDLAQLKEILIEARTNKAYATVALDMFSMVVNEWIDANAVQKKKRMTQQMWGDIKTDTDELTKLTHILSETKIVVLTCHEVSDSFEGMEDEIAPDIRPNVGKGSRTYLEGMANYGIHTTIIMKDKEQPDGSTQQEPVYAAHLGANPFYWVKTQKPSEIKLPKIVLNPTYSKIMRLLSGETKVKKTKPQ